MSVYTLTTERSNQVNELYDKAKRYVQDTPELAPYEDIIFYDWPEGDESLEWVLTASVREVVDWADAIRRSEQEQAEEEERNN